MAQICTVPSKYEVKIDGAVAQKINVFDRNLPLLKVRSEQGDKTNASLAKRKR